MAPRSSALSDVIACASLGLRDGISPKLIAFSVALWVGAVMLWTLILVFAWSVLEAVAAFITAWVFLGIFRIFPGWLPASAREKITGVSLADGGQALLGPVFTTLTWIVLVALILAAIYATARIAVEFWLMPAIRKVVERHYPPFPQHPPYSLLSTVTNFAKTSTVAVVLGLPFLLVPVVNVALLFVLFGYLNVRTLVNEALDGVATRQEQRIVIRAARGRMIAMGSLLAGILAIPVVGLLTPTVTGAATCHLCLRELRRQREGSPEPHL
jgi:ABC-type multidrug transport system, ATPase and permease components